MTRDEIADWLDQRGIRWAGAARDAKRPKSTRPKVDEDGNKVPSVPWDVHFDEGRMKAGQAEWRSGVLADMYLWPSSINAGDEGAACADFDRPEAESDARWLREEVASKPILEFVKPEGADGSGQGVKRHVWIATNVRPGNGELHDGDGAVLGHWRGRTDEGTLGVGMRMYPGEVEALIGALGEGFGHPMNRAQWGKTSGTAPRDTDMDKPSVARVIRQALGCGTVEIGIAKLRHLANDRGEGRNDSVYRVACSLIWHGALTESNRAEVESQLIAVQGELRAGESRDVTREVPEQIDHAFAFIAGQGGPGVLADDGAEPVPPPPDDLAGDLALWAGYREAFRKQQADRKPGTLRALREAGNDLLASIAGRVGEGGDETDDPGAALDALRSAFDAEGEDGVRQVLREREKRGIVADPVDWREAAPERVWLVPKWMPCGRLGMLTGEGEAGKSRVTLQLAAAVASGAKVWIPPIGTAHSVRVNDDLCGSGLPVVIATWEDEADELRRRLHGMRGVGIRADAVFDRLHHADMSGAGPIWAPAKGGSGHTSTMGALTDAGRWLRRFCAEKGARLLIVDPLASAFACNENDRGLVSTFLADWDSWGMTLNPDCACLLVSHPSRASGGSSIEQSGSTSWQGRSRFTWKMGSEKYGEKPKEGEDDREHVMRLSLTKSNYLAVRKPDPVWLEPEGAGWMVRPAPKGEGGADRHLRDNRIVPDEDDDDGL